MRDGRPLREERPLVRPVQGRVRPLARPRHERAHEDRGPPARRRARREVRPPAARPLEPLPERAAALTFGELLDRWWTETDRDCGRRPSGSSRRSTSAASSARSRSPRSTRAGSRPSSQRRPASSRRRRGTTSAPPRTGSSPGRIRRKLWAGANPAAAVPRLKVPKRLPRYLQPDEVRAVLAALDRRWRAIFATAFYLGLRRGEILALRKSDVDLADRTLARRPLVRRRHDEGRARGPAADPGRARAVARGGGRGPRAPSSCSPAETAMQRDPTTLRRTSSAARSAAPASSPATSTRCRRKGCGFEEQSPHPTRAAARSATCGSGRRRFRSKLRFHDLRHTTATLLLKAGVPLATVQRILRHTDPRITADDLRPPRPGGHARRAREADARARRPRPPGRASARLLAAKAPSAGPEQVPMPFAARPCCWRVPGRRKSKAASARRLPNNDAAFRWSGRQDLNLRPLGPEPSALPG